MVAGASLAASLAVLASLAVAAPLEPRAVPGPVKNVLPAIIASNAGAYSPYEAKGVYSSPPSGCTINQVNILQRHGQRFPTANQAGNIKDGLKDLQKAESYSPELAWIADYKCVPSVSLCAKRTDALPARGFELGTDDLIPNGAAELYDAGRTAFSRYSALYPPFVRTDTDPRVMDSAGNWTQGYYLRKRVQFPPAPLAIDNSLGQNNTLDTEGAGCPLLPDLGDIKSAWRKTYLADTVDRINALAPGSKLKAKGANNLQLLCIHETNYYGKVSPWCDLFTESDWNGLGYFLDIKSYSEDGLGNPVGASMGVGWVNELLSRLTGNRYWHQHDQTSVNHTLDNDPATFPLDKSHYTDLTHDSQIASVIAAMGLRNGGANLTEAGPPAGQNWFTTQQTPYAAHLVVERLQCTSGVTRPGTYVRIILNDKLQMPTFCAGYDATTGLCSLSDFTQSQTYVRANSNGEWAGCGWGQQPVAEEDD
ncbi:hypothetical protein JCM8097_002396 [Rhodosporidiobolus ruineniae]